MSVPSKQSTPFPKIVTSGDLRSFLLDVMVGVRDGTVEVQKASVITKLAQQTTENMYAELKARKMALDAGQTADNVGGLVLGPVTERPIK